MAALGYFKSPTTGNAVTWDGSGKQTDTGIAHGAYQMPTQVSLGDGPQDPGRMYRGGSATFNEGAVQGDITGAAQSAVGQMSPQPGANPAPTQPAQPANNYFVSPSTGNMVTWDATGKQTDTGQKPGNGTGYSSMTPGMGDSNKSFIDAQATPGANRYATSTHGTSGSNNVILSDSNGINGVWGNQGEYDRNVAANKAAGATALPNPGTGGGATGGAGSSGGIIGTGATAQQVTGTPGSSGNTSQASSALNTATSGIGNWQVTPDQTVEGRIGGIINSNSPLMQQARTRALQQQNERGTVNSSMATTAADSAVYDAAQRIAQPDAGMFGDAAKTNAMAQTSSSISQNNNQTSRDINSANIGAQKELQHANQLYNNLATQTASANSIQGWGLNTITTIQSSDLSAPAKDKAINSVRQYLADSYKIQGDWHTTAAKTIDAIFK